MFLLNIADIYCMALLGSFFGAAVLSGIIFWILYHFISKKSKAPIISLVLSFCITSLVTVIIFNFGANNAEEFKRGFWMYPFAALLFMYIGFIRYRFKKKSETQGNEEKDKNEQKAMSSFILGIFSMIAWLLPLVGLPAAITGLIFGIQSSPNSKRNLYITGVVLCVIGITLSIVNSAFGIFLNIKK